MTTRTYALIVRFGLYQDIFRIPIPFEARDDDHARLLADRLKPWVTVNSGWSYVEQMYLVDLSSKATVDWDGEVRQ